MRVFIATGLLLLSGCGILNIPLPGEEWRVKGSDTSVGVETETSMTTEATTATETATDSSLVASCSAPPSSVGGQMTCSLGTVSMNFQYIPSGTFLMGAGSDDDEAGGDEKPQHEVTISRPFLMAQSEVTQEQYVAVTGLDNPSSFFSVANGPVENVSWTDSVDYCNRLSDLVGISRAYDAGHNVTLSADGFRLPTEAEWEYAGRAATTAPRYGALDDIAWYSGNSGDITHSVMTKTPNSWGLYDMLGNVWEWTGDWYGKYSSAASQDPQGPLGGSYRVYRGGSWSYDARNARASDRGDYGPVDRGGVLGLRPARSLPGSLSTGTATSTETATATETAASTETATDASLAASCSAAPSTVGGQMTCSLGTVSMNFQYIPSGTFLMGAGSDDAEAYGDEKPQHEVTISRPFLMAQSEVTQKQYVAVTGLDNPSSFESVVNGPVENVSWTDSVDYCNRLSDLIGISRAYDASSNVSLTSSGFRLPTEAEWEYAARAGTTSSRYGVLDEIAWYSGNSDQTTHSVMTKAPNAWGLYDMLGNVWEWTGDWYAGYSSGAAVDPTGPSGGSNRVNRGGSWAYDARYARASFRYYFDPGTRWATWAFRPARSLP